MVKLLLLTGPQAGPFAAPDKRRQLPAPTIANDYLFHLDRPPSRPAPHDPVIWPAFRMNEFISATVSSPCRHETAFPQQLPGLALCYDALIGEYP
jgi:hypothetical protein